MNITYAISRFARGWSETGFPGAEEPPWWATGRAETLIADAIGRLDEGYRLEGQMAVHRSAVIEPGATLKGKGIIGPRCLVAAGAYLRGGVYLAEDCAVGPGSEVKTSFLSARSKVAHLAFVGDSILGSDVNVEAGAVVANHRNELANKLIRIVHERTTIETGVTKFGSLIGDGARIGANAVIAPGALLSPAMIVGRLQLVDQYPVSG